MKLTSTSFANGDKIPGEFSFCTPDPAHHVCLGKNLNPHLAWSDAPAGTQSFAIICHDPDVPSVGTDVNQEGRTVPAALPRVDFFHWVLIDLPATINSIAEGEFSSNVTPRGKPGPHSLHGSRQGLTTTPSGSLATTTCVATITATMDPAHPGMMKSFITTYLRSMHWILKDCRSTGNSVARMCALPCKDISWPRPA